MAFLRLPSAILCFCLMSFITSVSAQTESLHISTFHSDFGIKLLGEGDSPQAVDQFIKALFFSPSNKIAKEKILNLLRENGGAFASESKSVKLQIFRLVELAEYITFLKDRLQRLERQNLENIQYLLAQTTESEPVKEEIRALERKRAGDKSSLIVQPVEIQRANADRRSTVNTVNTYFLAVKESLLSKFSLALSISERLNVLRAQVVKSTADKQRRELASGYESRLTAIKRQVVHRDKILENQEKQVRLLQKELASVRADFTYLHSKMNGNSEKLGEVTDKVTAMSLQVYEKDALLAERSGLITQLQNDLNDAKQRWELVQKIIQEKDIQIKELEQRSSGLAGDISRTPASDGGGKMKTLQANLTILQKKMDEQEALNHQTIGALRKEFALLQEQYVQLEKDSGVKDTEIGRLHKVISVKNKKLNDVAQFFDAYDKDIVQLNGVLEIYRGKLNEAHMSLTGKDQKLEELEKEVNVLKQQGRGQVLRESQVGMISNRIDAGDLKESDVLQKTKDNLEVLLPDYVPLNSR